MLVLIKFISELCEIVLYVSKIFCKTGTCDHKYISHESHLSVCIQIDNLTKLCEIVYTRDIGVCSTGMCHLCVYQQNNLYSEPVGNWQIVHFCVCASKFVCLSFGR